MNAASTSGSRLLAWDGPRGAARAASVGLAILIVGAGLWVTVILGRQTTDRGRIELVRGPTTTTIVGENVNQPAPLITGSTVVLNATAVLAASDGDRAAQANPGATPTTEATAVSAAAGVTFTPASPVPIVTIPNPSVPVTTTQQAAPPTTVPATAAPPTTAPPATRPPTTTAPTTTPATTTAPTMTTARNVQLRLCPSDASALNALLKTDPSLSAENPGHRCPATVWQFEHPGNFVEWVLPASTTRSTATITIRYLNGYAAAAPLLVRVGNQSFSLAAPPTGNWSNWQELSVTANVGPSATVTVSWNSASDGFPLRSLNIDTVAVESR